MSTPTKADVVVLGGGLTGLYAALQAARTGKSVIVLEMEKEPGGQARGQRFGANDYEFGVETFRGDGGKISEDYQKLTDSELTEVEAMELKRIGEVEAELPLNFGDFSDAINTLNTMAGLGGMAGTALAQKISSKAPKNAEQALKQIYGGPIYKNFFASAMESFWGVPAAEISPDYVRKGMNRLTALDGVREKLGKMKLGSSEDAGKAQEKTGPAWYSRSGSNGFLKSMQRELVAQGGTIYCNAEVSELVCEESKVRAIRWNDLRSDPEDPVTHLVLCESVISTIPLRALVRAFGTQAPAQVHASSLHMRFRPGVVFGLLVKKNGCLNGISTEFSNRSFFRLSEPRNGGMRVDPRDHTILLVEMTTDLNSPIWNGEEMAFSSVLDDLEAEEILKRDQIVERHQITIANAHPMWKLEFEDHRERIDQYLARFPNLSTAGKSGTHTFPTMLEALQQGQLAAEKSIASLG